jgi:ApaG protein
MTSNSQSPNSDTESHGIRIEAAAQYLPQESDPDSGKYFYVYRIRILNEGEHHARLLTRHWVILDSNNQREDVTGEGVVGQHPNLGPGEMFEYRSYCPLRTEWGTMEGTYTFAREGGETFEAKIGRFFLVPTAKNSVVPD